MPRHTAPGTVGDAAAARGEHLRLIDGSAGRGAGGGGGQELHGRCFPTLPSGQTCRHGGLGMPVIALLVVSVAAGTLASLIARFVLGRWWGRGPSSAVAEEGREHT